MTAVTTGRDPADHPATPPPTPAPPAPPAPKPINTGTASAQRPAREAPATALTQPNGHDPVDVEAPAGNVGVRVSVRPRQRRRLTPLRWTALALLTVLLVGAGAAAGNTVADRMPPMYAAHADVLYPLVQEQPTGFLRQDRNLSTQEVLIASRTVLDPVAAEFGIPVEDLADELTTEVVEESEVIRVQFTDTSRAQARKVLAAILAQYVAVANDPARTEVRAYLDAQLADVQARLATARANAEGEDLGLTQAAQAEINALVQREATLLAQIDEEQFAAIAGPAPQITVPAYVEHDAVSPQPLLVMGGGALAGLVVALVTVAVVARRLTRP